MPVGNAGVRQYDRAMKAAAVASQATGNPDIRPHDRSDTIDQPAAVYAHALAKQNHIMQVGRCKPASQLLAGGTRVLHACQLRFRQPECRPREANRGKGDRAIGDSQGRNLPGSRATGQPRFGKVMAHGLDQAGGFKIGHGAKSQQQVRAIGDRGAAFGRRCVQTGAGQVELADLHGMAPRCRERQFKYRGSVARSQRRGFRRCRGDLMRAPRFRGAAHPIRMRSDAPACQTVGAESRHSRRAYPIRSPCTFQRPVLHRHWHSRT